MLSNLYIMIGILKKLSFFSYLECCNKFILMNFTPKRILFVLHMSSFYHWFYLHLYPFINIILCFFFIMYIVSRIKLWKYARSVGSCLCYYQYKFEQIQDMRLNNFFPSTILFTYVPIHHLYFIQSVIIQTSMQYFINYNK